MPTDPFDLTVPQTTPQEHEFDREAERAFADLHGHLVRDVERARMLCGGLVVLGVALLRRLWFVGRAGAPLALYALCAFAAAGLLFSLSRHLGGGVAAARAVTTTRGRDLSHAMTLLAAMRGLFRTLWVALLALAALVLIALAVQLTAA